MCVRAYVHGVRVCTRACMHAHARLGLCLGSDQPSVRGIIYTSLAPAMFFSLDLQRPLVVSAAIRTLKPKSGIPQTPAGLCDKFCLTCLPPFCLCVRLRMHACLHACACYLNMPLHAAIPCSEASCFMFLPEWLRSQKFRHDFSSYNQADP